MNDPVIIQGGMGVAVSNWRLARAVSQAGQLGVVSGTFLDAVVARRLQDGDMDGSMRRAFDHFPYQDVAQRIWDRYFVEGGKAPAEAYRPVPMHGASPQTGLTELTVVANFAEVFLAKEGHNGLVGINYLMKIELPTLPSLYGALLAGVDYVLMGAGIPRAIPGMLDKLSRHEPVSLKLDVKDAEPGEEFEITFDPRVFTPRAAAALVRPKFLPIVSSATLAQSLARKASGTVDGFVVEHHTAGGHNAPPRGGVTVDEHGEPVYGPKDEFDLEGFRKLGLPFWLAGSCASPEKLKEAQQAGARGVQVGSAFAYCRESGIRQDIKERVIESILRGQARVFTDPLASASGYPFKIVAVEGSLSESDVYETRPRICDLGYLRTAYRRSDGSVGFRCPAEPVEDYVRKGGRAEDVVGKKCLCNGLMSTVGYPQIQKHGYLEPPLITAGKDLSVIARLVAPGETSYSAMDVLRYLLGSTNRSDERQPMPASAAAARARRA